LNFQQDLSTCQHWSIRTDTLFLSHEVDFKLGEPRTDTTMDGRNIEFVIRQADANKYVFKATTLHRYTLAGFDLTTHYSAGGDDVTRPRRQGNKYVFIISGSNPARV
jgi:hypothetical protein